MSLEPLLSRIEPWGTIPPVEQWHPEHCGEIDLEIAADGRWIHEGTPLTRPRLVRLLSTLLRRDADGAHYLVTPQERLRLRVSDCPFVVVDADPDHAGWWLTTNVGDRLRLGTAHRLTVTLTPEGVAVPEVTVRGGLRARLGRSLFYRLVDNAEARPDEAGGVALGLVSDGVWQPLGRLAAEDI